MFSISDLFIKIIEFHSWLIEVKHKSKEDLKNIDRKYYDEFIHNYNNCKFSNKKYVFYINLGITISINGKQKRRISCFLNTNDLEKRIMIISKPIISLRMMLNLYLMMKERRRKRRNC